MGTVCFLHLAVTGGTKLEVDAFDRIALSLPVLSEYVIERDGKPIDYAMYEDMVFEPPRRWGRHWWRSRYDFNMIEPRPAVELLQSASSKFPRLCFQVDWSYEHEEYGSYFCYRSKVEAREYAGQRLRERFYQQLVKAASTGGYIKGWPRAPKKRIVQYWTRPEDDGQDEIALAVDSYVDGRFCEVIYARLEKLWRRKTFDILRAQRRHPTKR
jgi:hypothetical protein